MILKPIKLKTEIRKELSEYLDPTLIKERESGKKYNEKTRKWEPNMLSYISANTCIDILNDIFGHNWSFRIVDRWMEPGVPSPFVEKEGKKPIPQPPTAWCIVELTVPLIDEEGEIHYITKSAFGSQAINGNQATQSVNGYKGAQSDALKKAATQFGIALELYRDPEEEAFFHEMTYKTLMPIIWTDEVIKENEEQWDEYLKIKKENGWSDDDITYFVRQVTDDEINDIHKMPVVYMSHLLNAMNDFNEEEE